MNMNLQRKLFNSLKENKGAMLTNKEVQTLFNYLNFAPISQKQEQFLKTLRRKDGHVFFVKVRSGDNSTRKKGLMVREGTLNKLDNVGLIELKTIGDDLYARLTKEGLDYV